MRTNNRTGIVSEILERRRYQDVRWGGSDHDDQHSPHDWVAFLTVYLGQAVKMDDWSLNLNTFRDKMIDVAALALAAIEWVDRNVQA